MKKGSNSVKNGRILPINNPIPLIADNNMYAKFEKIPWINTQVIDRKWWAWTDGRTDGRTDTEGYNIIPRHTLVAGYKKGNFNALQHASKGQLHSVANHVKMQRKGQSRVYKNQNFQSLGQCRGEDLNGSGAECPTVPHYGESLSAVLIMLNMVELRCIWQLKPQSHQAKFPLHWHGVV